MLTPGEIYPGCKVVKVTKVRLGRHVCDLVQIQLPPIKNDGTKIFEIDLTRHVIRCPNDRTPLVYFDPVLTRGIGEDASYQQQARCPKCGFTGDYRPSEERIGRVKETGNYIIRC